MILCTSAAKAAAFAGHVIAALKALHLEMRNRWNSRASSLSSVRDSQVSRSQDCRARLSQFSASRLRQFLVNAINQTFFFRHLDSRQSSIFPSLAAAFSSYLLERRGGGLDLTTHKQAGPGSSGTWMLLSRRISSDCGFSPVECFLRHGFSQRF